MVLLQKLLRNMARKSVNLRRRFITEFTTALHLSLSFASSVQSVPF
jgi:hypothetical protein